MKNNSFIPPVISLIIFPFTAGQIFQTRAYQTHTEKRAAKLPVLKLKSEPVQISEDAAILALRKQTSVFLDSSLASKINSALKITLLADLFKKNHDIVFAPPDCINLYYWYVIVKPVEEQPRDFSKAQIYRWNIPPRYAMTMFVNTSAVLDSVKNSDKWWIRKHAIEGINLFLQKNNPWCSEDNNNHWYELKRELISDNYNVIKVLDEAANDPGDSVRALDTLSNYDLIKEKNNPIRDFRLLQNYPDPFNPAAKIRYSIPNVVTHRYASAWIVQIKSG